MKRETTIDLNGNTIASRTPAHDADRAAREALVDEMLAARTPSEAKAAEAVLTTWLRRHPDDDSVRFAEEQLHPKADALRALHGDWPASGSLA